MELRPAPLVEVANSRLHGDVLRAVSDNCANVVVVSDQRRDARYPAHRYIAAGE